MAVPTTYKKQPFLLWLSTISSLGYAFPGAILAIGVVTFAGGVDGLIQEIYVYFSVAANNGFLIGGASQNAKKFIDIVKKTYS